MCRYTLRQLTTKDASSLKEMRLYALRESPSSFGNSIEDEVKKSLAQTEDDIRKDIIYAAICADGAIIGMAGCTQNTLRKLKHKAHIYGIYVRPQWRQKQLMRELLAALLDEACKTHSIILTSVTAGNEHALRCFKGFGFHKCYTEKNALCDKGDYSDLIHLRLEKY